MAADFAQSFVIHKRTACVSVVSNICRLDDEDTVVRCCKLSVCILDFLVSILVVCCYCMCVTTWLAQQEVVCNLGFLKMTFALIASPDL